MLPTELVCTCLRGLCGFLLLPALLLPTRGLAQCSGDGVVDASDYITRTSGNQLISYAQASLSGADAPYWQLYLSTWLYQSNTLIAWNSGATAGPGQSVGYKWTTNLQVQGTGTYDMQAYVSAYNAACQLSDPPYYDGWNGWLNSGTTVVSRPAISGVNAFWWHGPGVTSDRGYYAQAQFTAIPNGAPGVPSSWGVTTVSGGGSMTLSCSICTVNTATSTSPSNGCVSDVTVTASYGGFLSQPFPVLINTPKNTTLQPGVPNDQASGGGYLSKTDWALTDLCGYVASGLDGNEVFGAWTDDYYATMGVHNNWGTPTASSPMCPATYGRTRRAARRCLTSIPSRHRRATRFRLRRSPTIHLGDFSWVALPLVPESRCAPTHNSIIWIMGGTTEGRGPRDSVATGPLENYEQNER